MAFHQLVCHRASIFQRPTGVRNEVNARLFEKRAAQGDPTVFQEYAEWLATLAPRKGSRNLGGGIADYAVMALPTMWEHPDEPAMSKLSEKIFADKHSPWIPVTARDHYSFSPLSHTSLLSVPAFRKLVQKFLEDTSVMGFIRTDTNGRADTLLKG